MAAILSRPPCVNPLSYSPFVRAAVSQMTAQILISLVRDLNSFRLCCCSAPTLNLVDFKLTFGQPNIYYVCQLKILAPRAYRPDQISWSKLFQAMDWHLRATKQIIWTYADICQINGALTFFIYYFNCFFLRLIITCRLWVIYVREDNYSNV